MYVSYFILDYYLFQLVCLLLTYCSATADVI